MLGAVVASTDAAAVFATLRFTTLRRRLSRVLEAESGGNDPMAVALTIGLIEWLQDPSFRADDLRCSSSGSSGWASSSGSRSASLAAWHARAAARVDRAVRAGRLARRRRARLRRRGRRRRQRLPRRLHRRAVGRQRGDAAPARARRLPPGRRLPRADRTVRPARPLRLPEPAAARSCSRGWRSPRVVVFVARPGRRVDLDRVPGLHDAASGRCSAGPDCAAPCRSCSPRSRRRRGSPEQRARSSTPSSSSCSSRRSCRGRRSSGSRARLRPDDAGETRLPAADRDRRRPRARRRPARVRGRAGRGGRRDLRPRPRACRATRSWP